MAATTTIVCDVCRAKRQDKSAGWLMLDTTTKSAVLTKWDDELVKSVEFHLCGDGCAFAKLSEVMGEWRGKKVVSLDRLMAPREDAACATK